MEEKENTYNERESIETEPILFYPPEFYPFDNFSSFQIEYDEKNFPTTEHLYHYQKFEYTDPNLAEEIRETKSAYDSLKLAHANVDKQREDWDDVKYEIMKSILRLKVEQHPYVRKKLLQSGERIIIENSHRDAIWGWGEQKDGLNLLGKAWMEIREEVKQQENLNNIS